MHAAREVNRKEKLWKKAGHYTFALKLAASQKKPSACPLLDEEQYKDQREALNEIVIDAPAIG